MVFVSRSGNIADTAATVQVEWPSGTKQSFANVGANKRIVIDETRGLR